MYEKIRMRWLDCNANNLYPMNPGVTLDFGDVKVTGFYGHHINLRASPADVAQLGADMGARVIISHHMDLSKTPEEYLPRVEELGVEFKKLAPDGEVVFHPQGEWFEV